MFYSITINRNCNFNCLYCYQKNKSHTVISDATIDNISNFILKNAVELNDTEVLINISGGECLLYPDKVKSVIENIRCNLTKNNFPDPIIEVSTNISLFTKDIYDFFKETNCKLFIGFDGIEESQNMNRLFNNKTKTFNDCFEKLQLLKDDKNYANKVTINSVISNNNVQYLNENFIWLTSTFPDFNISFNLAYNSNWNNQSLQLLENQLYALAESYYAKLLTAPEYSINIFDRQIEMILKEHQSMDYLCGATKSSLGITCEGDIIACSTCTGMSCENEFIIGNVNIGIDNFKKQEFLQRLTRIDGNEKCRECQFNKRCYKYCPSSNFLSSGDMFKVSRTMCELNKKLIEVSEYILIKLYDYDKDIVHVSSKI